MIKLRIALVEIGGSHDECLFTQILALSSIEAEITFVTTREVYDRNKHFLPYIHHTYFFETSGKAIADFKNARRLVRFFKQQDIQKVVFNTAQGGQIRNISLLLPGRIQAFGIIHTIRKFHGSFTHKIINRKIKNFLVLSDDLLKRIAPQKNSTIGSFYPIDFPRLGKDIHKSDDACWVTLTGGVENRRKDLTGFVSLVEQTPANVSFIFLGKTDVTREDVGQLFEELKARNLMNRIVYFDSFIDAETFDGYLTKTDFLLPLIHPTTQSAEQYVVNQISGAFTLSFGYHIPLLMHVAFQNELDLQQASFFYDPIHFNRDFTTALHENGTKRQQLKHNPKWQSEAQQDIYLRFLETHE